MLAPTWDSRTIGIFAPKAPGSQKLPAKRTFGDKGAAAGDMTLAATCKSRSIEVFAPKALYRKKVIATASRHERACKRTGETSAPFCEKRRSSDAGDNFLCKHKKSEQAKLAPTWDSRTIEVFAAPKAHTRKKLVAQRRRYARVYKGIAAASVAFYERGAAAE